MGRSTIRTQDRRRNILPPFSLGRARGLVDLNYTKCFSICISYAHVCGISSTAPTSNANSPFIPGGTDHERRELRLFVTSEIKGEERRGEEEEGKG